MEAIGVSILLYLLCATSFGGFAYMLYHLGLLVQEPGRLKGMAGSSAVFGAAFLFGFVFAAVPIYGLVHLAAYFAIYLMHDVVYEKRSRIIKAFDTGYFMIDVVISQIMFQTFLQIFVGERIRDMYASNIWRPLILIGMCIIMMITTRVARETVPMENFRTMYGVTRFIRHLFRTIHIMIIIAAFVLLIEYQMPFVAIANVLILIAVALFFLIYSLSVDFVIKEAVNLTRQIGQLDEQLKLQMTGYNKQADYIRDLRMIREEHASHLDEISKILDGGDVAAAKKLIESIPSPEVAATSFYTKYSNSVVLDAILNETAKDCDALDIKFEGTMDVDGDLALSDHELMTLFVNLMRNAKDGAMTPGLEDRFIRVKSVKKGGWISFIIENSFDPKLADKIAKDNEKLSEDDAQRIGLGVVKRIVEESDGLMSVITSSDKQSYIVNLNFPCKNEKGGKEWI